KLQLSTNNYVYLLPCNGNEGIIQIFVIHANYLTMLKVDSTQKYTSRPQWGHQFEAVWGGQQEEWPPSTLLGSHAAQLGWGWEKTTNTHTNPQPNPTQIWGTT
ncbi:hypothetical protein, partial [Enterobacter cloacae complex sp. 4DZ1-17B1]|uniref:hypothetical protein n=1 Tax=Enterobacter cloacae complex sp. 4DZ1-17B1 TaxID=2511991 RepID=UPI001CA4ED4B